MPGPFPGMDPYVEEEWGDFHVGLIYSVRTQLNQRLPKDLVCRAEECVIGEDRDAFEPPARYRPDSYVMEPEQRSQTAMAQSTATLDPIESGVETFTVECEPQRERWLEIRTANGGRVVTSLEVLSPSNKRGRGWELFMAKQRRLVASGVSLVEIDLLRRGHWSVYPPIEDVPERFREPYRLVATSAHEWPRSTFSRVKLRESLPPVSVPLRPGERQVTLDLQPLVDQVWLGGRYGGRYDSEPPPFPAEDAAWIAERVSAWNAGRGEQAGSADALDAKEDQQGSAPTAPPTAV
ncbi:MAG: DUF4058 family protein [Planctomycetota bacterium]